MIEPGLAAYNLDLNIESLKIWHKACLRYGISRVFEVARRWSKGKPALSAYQMLEILAYFRSNYDEEQAKDLLTDHEKNWMFYIDGRCTHSTKRKSVAKQREDPAFIPKKKIDKGRTAKMLPEHMILGLLGDDGKNLDELEALILESHPMLEEVTCLGHKMGGLRRRGKAIRINGRWYSL